MFLAKAIFTSTFFLSPNICYSETRKYWLPQEAEEYYSCPLWCDNQFGSLFSSLEPHTNFSVAEC